MFDNRICYNVLYMLHILPTTKMFAFRKPVLDTFISYKSIHIYIYIYKKWFRWIFTIPNDIENNMLNTIYALFHYIIQRVPRSVFHGWYKTDSIMPFSRRQKTLTLLKFAFADIILTSNLEAIPSIFSLLHS